MTAVDIPVSGIQLTSTGVRPILATGGATVNSGAFVYSDASDSNELKAADVTTSAGANVVGALLQGTTDGAGAVYCGNGCVVSGYASLSQVWYAVDTTGKLTDDPHTDLAASEYITWVGYGDANGDLVIDINATGETV